MKGTFASKAKSVNQLNSNKELCLQHCNVYENQMMKRYCYVYGIWM